MAPIPRLPKGLTLIHFRIYPTIPGWYGGRRGVQSLQMLGSLVRNACQHVPDAKVILSSTNEGQVLFDGVLSRS